MKDGLEPAETALMRSEYKKRVKAAQVAEAKAKKKVYLSLSPPIGLSMSSFP